MLEAAQNFVSLAPTCTLLPQVAQLLIVFSQLYVYETRFSRLS